MNYESLTMINNKHQYDKEKRNNPVEKSTKKYKFYFQNKHMLRFTDNKRNIHENNDIF